MGITAKGVSTAPKEIVPAGTHLARCYSMIHVGTVKWEWQGEVKHTDKVRITFELPNEKRVFNEEAGEMPMVISQEYSLTLHEKSNLRKDLETWRGKAFSEQEIQGFDICNLLGASCYLSIVHSDTKTGTTFAKIGGISKLPKGVECPEQINPTFVFNYEDRFNQDWVDNIAPQFLSDMIKSTPEYQNKTKNDNITRTQEGQDKNDDLPF